MASSSLGPEPRPLGLPLAALIGVLVAARVLFFLVPFVLPDSAWPSGTRAVVKADISRYQQIATTPGTPYRDFEVEYPPVALGVIEWLHGPTAGATAVGIGIMSLVLDLVVAALLFLYAGTEVAVAYLIVGTPIALFSLFRVDLLSVALAMLAVVMVSEGRQRTGGVLLTMGVFTKIWPIFIAPLFVVRRQLKGLAWWTGTTAAAAVAWIAWSGWRGPLQVLSFRGARGWEIESLVGSIVWTVTSKRPHLEAGAPRVGTAPLPARLALLAVLLALVAVAWTRAARAFRSRPDGPDPALLGLAVTTVVGLVLLSSPILSPQYLCWLVPWVALAAGLRDRPLLALAFFLMLMTALVWFVPLSHARVFQALLLTRNVGLVSLVAIGFGRLGKLPAPSAATGRV